MSGDTTQDSFKERQRQSWNDRGIGWDKRAEEMAEMARRLNEPLLDLVGIAAGQRVLDLASGAGEPALTIAELIGDTGHVTATDLAEGMLAGARRRAADRGLGNIGFEIADAEALPFPDAGIDRVTCRFGLMFFPDKLKALRECLRVLTPGGRAGFMVWGPLTDNAVFQINMAAVQEVMGPQDETFLEMPFILGQPGVLVGLLEQAGFTGVEEQVIQARRKAPGDQPFWRTNLDMSFGRLWMEAGAAERDAVEAAVVRRLQEYREGDHYRLPVHVRYAAGGKPGA
ncbi:class I SAM-dependent methyltransferase [Oceanibaculum nanhaiense]|uniref:class I SAM-dependent methyltransferase n=1 Tax=Oceanibaculum nanhaiense TaxID=1909734 RepID=UPI003D2DB781